MLMQFETSLETSLVRPRVQPYIPRERWGQQLRGFVVPTVRSAGPTGTAQMEQYLRVLRVLRAFFGSALIEAGLEDPRAPVGDGIRPSCVMKSASSSRGVGVGLASPYVLRFGW
jgi:hypothetical protein